MRVGKRPRSGLAKEKKAGRVVARAKRKGTKRGYKSRRQAAPTSVAGKARGGQPRNLNALKHGFYARQFAAVERSDLDAAAVGGLSVEITMLRVVARRLLAMSAREKSAVRLAETLETLGSASVKLATLLRTEKFLSGEGGPGGALEQALREVAEGLGLHE